MVNDKFLKQQCQRFLELLKAAATDAENPLQWLAQVVRDNISDEHPVEEPLQWMCHRTVPSVQDGVIQIHLLTQIAVPSDDMEHVTEMLGEVNGVEEVSLIEDEYTLFDFKRLAMQANGDELILLDEDFSFKTEFTAT
jgi:hypothetical protein